MANINIKTFKYSEYDDLAEAWDFYLQSYLGGIDYIEDNLFSYFKEGSTEFEERKDRAYRENHCRKIINIFNSYLFKENPNRSISNKNTMAILDNIDGKNHNINFFMADVNSYVSTLGRLYIMVDRPKTEIKNNRDNLNPKNSPYAYMIFPQNVLDISFDNNGNINWMFVRETYRDDANPFKIKDEEYRYRLWQKNGWMLFDKNGALIDEGILTLGYIPCIIIDNEDGNSLYNGRSDIEDIAYIDRSIFNNWSRIDTIVNDQTFSQLIFPIEGFSADVLQNTKLMEQYLTVGTKRVLLYSAQAGTTPEFISPDATQADFILDLVKSQTNQLYSLLGLSGEVAKESTAASGISKSYEFDKLNKKLAGKTTRLQSAEIQMINIIQDYLGVSSEFSVTYPSEFDTRSLFEEIAIAKDLATLNISNTFSKEMYSNIVNKLFANSDDKIKNTIKKEINKSIDDKGLEDQIDIDKKIDVKDKQ